MKIKDTKELTEIAEFWRMNKKAVSTLIIWNLKKIDSSFDSSDFYGVTIAEFIDGIGEDLRYTFNRMFPIAWDTDLNTFGNLILFGDYDCPECGGKLEFHDGESKQIAGDYFTPPEFETIWEEQKCVNCGHLTTN